MKILTPCERAFKEEIPVLRMAIAKTLVDRGLSVIKASKAVGISSTTYEKNIKEKREIIEKVLSDDEIRDMIDALVGRMLANQTIEPESFCILCARARKLFNLPACPIY